MQYYIQCNDSIGSSYETIIKDLKTIKGVYNRIMKGYFRKGNYKIYTYTNIFDDKTFKLVYDFIK